MLPQFDFWYFAFLENSTEYSIFLYCAILSITEPEKGVKKFDSVHDLIFKIFLRYGPTITKNFRVE